VVQWALLYIAIAWGLAQGTAYLVDTFDWPRQWQQVATLVLLLGLPSVIVVAWFHGDRGHQHLVPLEAACLGVILVVGGVVLWRYPYQDRVAAESAAVPTGKAVARETRPSIAVLPFANRSAEADDAYFVEGIHDDILTELTRIGALRVISRTSVQQLDRKNRSIREIGSLLGVSKVLEGGVQRAGQRVRISVQLIDAAADAQLWAETYDRDLTATNIFDIQSEVATTVAHVLNAKLTAAEQTRAARIPTQNLEAWEAYQLGRQRQASRTATSLADSERFLQRAVNLDPEFALAHVALADTIQLQVSYLLIPRDKGLERAQLLADRALLLDPDLAEAITSAASLADERGQYEQAERGYRRAIALNPNYAQALHWYSLMLSKVGRYGEALRYAKQAAEVDPLSAIVQSSLGGSLVALGRFDEALKPLQRAAEIDPSMAVAVFEIGALHASAFGRIDEGLASIERAVELDPGNLRYWLTLNFLRMQLGGSQNALAERELEKAVRDDSPLAPLAAILPRLNNGNLERAHAAAKQLLDEDPRAGTGLLVMRNLAIRAHEPLVARDLYLKAYPEFAGSGALVLDDQTYPAAIDCAKVLYDTGMRDQAERLLSAADALVRQSQRMGLDGFGVSDALMHAIRGDKARTLAALTEADRAGWFMAWRYFRDWDPTFDFVRDDPEFVAIFKRVERRMDEQRAHIEARATER
jgi:TolB-like protein/Tfp pilus assembly protein PilF